MHSNLSLLKRCALAAAAVVSIFACTPSGAGSPSPTAEPSPTGPFRIAIGSLVAGDYTTTAFEPRLTFTLASGWFAFFPDDSDEIAFERGGSTGGFYMTRVTRVLDPLSGNPLDAPDDLVAWLADHPAFDVVLEPSDVVVAGRAGQAVVVDVVATSETETFAYETGNIRVRSGWRIQYNVIPMNGPNLVLVCFGTSKDAYDETLLLVETSLASLMIHD